MSDDLMTPGAQGSPRNGNGRGRGEFYVRVLRDVGFPIVVAAFLLYQIPLLRETLLDLTVTLHAVRTVLQEGTRDLREHRQVSEREQARELRE